MLLHRHRQAFTHSSIAEIREHQCQYGPGLMFVLLTSKGILLFCPVSLKAWARRKTSSTPTPRARKGRTWNRNRPSLSMYTEGSSAEEDTAHLELLSLCGLPVWWQHWKRCPAESTVPVRLPQTVSPAGPPPAPRPPETWHSPTAAWLDTHKPAVNKKISKYSKSNTLVCVVLHSTTMPFVLFLPWAGNHWPHG